MHQVGQNCGYHQCQGAFRNPTANLPMTFSIQHLPYICENNKFGCEEILNEVDLQEHEKYCIYQKINCVFLDKCKTEVGFLNYPDHILKDHPFFPATFETTQSAGVRLTQNDPSKIPSKSITVR